MEKRLPRIEIKVDQCKGCLLCIDACPKGLISVSPNFNALGYQHVQFVGENCTGCESCYYACPEPGAITVIKEKKKQGA